MDIERLDTGSQGNDREDQDQEEENEVLLAGNRLDDKNKKEKKRRPVKNFKLEDLTNRETGIKALYDTMKKNEHKLTKKAQTQPEKALEDYLSLVKEWAFNVAPKYEFSFFMDRCQAFGHKKEFTEELKNLRKYHKGELAYDDEKKDYIEASSHRNRVIVPAANTHREDREYQDEPKKLIPSKEYDPANDPDRALETFPDQEDLNYSIKKKVKMNPDDGSVSPAKFGQKMDEESNL